MFKNAGSGAVVAALDRRFKNSEKLIKPAAIKLLRLTKSSNSFLEIYLVNNRFMNRNVLAFRALKDFPRPDIKGRFLGEIYLNPDYIKKEKLPALGGEITDKLTYMLTHGFLHLLGYDHKKKTDRIKMEKKEQFLFKKLVISK